MGNTKDKTALIYALEDETGRRQPDGPALIYGRNSQLAKRGGGATGAPSLSVDSQLDECDRRVDRQDWPLVEADGKGGRGRFRDDGISASEYARRKTRPDWQKVMELISQGKVGVLVTWEVSRATRDRPVWAALMAACIENDVLMDVGGKTYDPCDPDDAFMLDLQASLAVRESGITRKRVGRLVRARAQAGQPHGLKNYGYRSVYDEATGKLLRRETWPEQAAIVQEIARRILAGESRYSIAKDLNKRDIPSPGGGEWTGSSMGQMIVRPAYAGLRTFRGEVVGDATWPLIISKKNHYRLIALTNDPDRDKYRQDSRVKHLLVGISECGKCKARTRAVPIPKKPSSFVYNCAKNYCFARQEDRVDELVESLMKAWLSQDDVLEQLASLDTSGEAGGAAAEVAELKTRLQKFYSQAAKGTLSEIGLAHIEAELLPMIAKAEKRAKPSILPSLVYDVAGPQADELWDGLGLLEKRTIIRALCRVIIHQTGKTGRGVFDPRYIEVLWLAERQDGEQADSHVGELANDDVKV
ncbi:recombinase family protein [Actinophytocola sediminis]